MHEDENRIPRWLFVFNLTTATYISIQLLYIHKTCPAAFPGHGKQSQSFLFPIFQISEDDARTRHRQLQQRLHNFLLRQPLFRE